MLMPIVHTRIEKRHQGAGLRVISGDVWPLRGVAMGAGETGILHRVWARMLRRADMVKLVRQDAMFLIDVAVFAAPVCALTDEISARLGHRSLRLPRFFQGPASLRLNN